VDIPLALRLLHSLDTAVIEKGIGVAEVAVDRFAEDTTSACLKVASCSSTDSCHP